LPIDVPCTSTFWPAANSPHGQLGARLVLAGHLGGDAEFLEHLAGLDTGLGQVPGFGLVDADALRLPNATWRAL
jgi:hypothetical protein